MRIPRFTTWKWLRVLSLLSVLLVAGCDDDWYHDDHDHDDYAYYRVTAEMTVVVRDHDTGLVVPGAEVRFYGDHGFYNDLDLYDNYVLAYTDSNGVASTTIAVYLSHPDQCIGIRAVAEYSDWTPDTTGEVRFWYPGGGVYATTLYLDDPHYQSASAETLEVPSSQFASIQAAIDVAQVGDRILVNDGTYNETIDFQGKNITVESRNGALATIIDGGNSQRPTVRFVTGEGPYAMLKGFTIRGGNLGIKIDEAKPSLADNRLESGIEGTPAQRVLPNPTDERMAVVDIGRAVLHSPSTQTASVPDQGIATQTWLLLLLLVAIGAVVTQRSWRRYQRSRSTTS